MKETISNIDYRILYLEEKSQKEKVILKYAALELLFNNLKKLIFGSKSEKFIPSNINTPQLSLDIQADALAECTIESEKEISYIRQQKKIVNKPAVHPGRHKLPEHLERRVRIVEPKEDITGLKKIGEEVSEELDWEPGSLFVNRTVRPKYAKANGEGVVVAPMIDRPLPKAIASAGLLAQISIDKYVDHLPLNRQRERFKREGINIPYSTFTNWVGGTCALINPVYETLKKQLLKSDYLHADETPVKVLDKDKKGESHRGYFWVYHNSIERMVLFDYQPGRGREGPVKMLEGFKGFLQTDGYSVYDFFKEKENITVLHCMAHARRMFYDSQESDKVRAEYALQEFGKLYDIEREAKEQSLTAEQCLKLRQEKSLPLLDQFGAWMNEQYVKVLPKSPIGKALGYSIKRWDELKIYASNGSLNIDNNPVENSLRPVAVGRKNYLFAGSHEAAQRSAMLYSLLGTCKLNGVNPFIWLRDVLQRIATHKICNIAELLPQNWKSQYPGE